MTEEEKEFASGFTNMLNKVLGLGVDTASKVVLQNIMRFYNKNKGYSYPSIPLLMNECQLSRQGVINAIKKLERLGYIKKETVKGKGNRYFLSEFCLYEKKHGLFTSQQGRPVNEVDPSTDLTSQQGRLHPSTDLTTPVNEVDPSTDLTSQQGRLHPSTDLTTPVNEVDPSTDLTSQQGRLHPSTDLTTPVNEVDPTNTNTITNTITNNNMSDSKESDAPPGAFKNDNNNSNKTNENTITTKSKGEKEKEKNSAKKKEKEQQIKEVVEYLNLKANRNYRPGTTKTKSLISARLKDYSVEDLKAVIDFKVGEWLENEKMNKYLRPETLFNETKFENYINELPSQATKKSSQSYLEDNDVELSLDDIIKINLGKTNKE